MIESSHVGNDPKSVSVSVTVSCCIEAIPVTNTGVAELIVGPELNIPDGIVAPWTV
jgi:hypothetical protein